MAETAVVAFLPCLATLTGSHSAAVTLCQIFYWSRGKLRVKRRGMYWLAKSRKELCSEAGISLGQYKRIMPALEEQGWILLQRGLFGNKITPFIRLTEKGMGVLLAHFPSEVPANQLVGYDHDLLEQEVKGHLDANHLERLVQDCTNGLVQDCTN